MLETTVGGDLEECRRRGKREGAKGREGGTNAFQNNKLSLMACYNYCSVTTPASS